MRLGTISIGILLLFTNHIQSVDGKWNKILFRYKMVHFGGKVLDKRVHKNKTIHIKIDIYSSCQLLQKADIYSPWLCQKSSPIVIYLWMIERTFYGRFIFLYTLYLFIFHVKIYLRFKDSGGTFLISRSHDLIKWILRVLSQSCD